MTDSVHRPGRVDQDSLPQLSQQMSQQILDSSDDCIKVLDLEGRILFVSRGGQALLGIQDISPFLHQAWTEFWPAAQQDTVREAIQKAGAGEVYSFQGYCFTQAGEPKWWDSKVSPIRNAKGQVERLLCILRDITGRKQAEAALNEHEAQYETLFKSMDEGCLLADVIFDEADQPIDLFYLEANPAATRILGQDWTQRRLQEINPNYESYWYETFGRVARTGQGERLQQYAKPDQRWYDFYVFKVGPEASRRVCVIFHDITERKRTEELSQRAAEFNKFCVVLADALRPLADPVAIQATASRILGEYLGVNRVAYFEVRGADYVVERDYANGVTPLVGSYSIDSFGPKLLAGFRTGRAVNSSDTAADPNLSSDQRLAYAAIQIGAYIGVPLIKGGDFVAGLAVHMATPRIWTADEVALAEEVAERTWAAVERARAEAALRDSEAKYRTLFNSLDEGFCLIEMLFDQTGKAYDYRFLEANPALEKHTGLANVVGKTVSELIPQHEAHWFEIYGQIALTGIPARFENRAEKLGRYFDVYAFRIGDPQERKVAVLFTDISSRRQAETEREQLLANERHYANQLQGLTKAALAINSVLSVEQVLQVITDQAAAIIGAHQSVTSMTVGQNWAQAINAVSLSEKYAQWRDYDEKPDGSGIYACVCHLNRPMRLTQAELEAHPRWNGFGSHVSNHPPMRGWLAAPLVRQDGQNIGLIQLSDKYEGEFTAADEAILVQLAQMASVAVENARLYKAEQQVRAAAEAAREEAQAANRVKDEFLAVLSHELRSPLNPILGWSTLLLNRQLDPAKTIQALTTIQRNAKLQSELIEDLLDVSRILRGKLSLNVVPVHLATLIRAALETVRLAAEAKSINLEVHLAPEIGLVSGDPTRLQQVIWNLLSNAVKFTPAGGRVEVRLGEMGEWGEGERGEDPARLTAFAQITVRDTGQGIASDFLPYVFDYFRQADSATTRRFGGLGLGLAIVRHLVELHGGTVEVASPGVGMGATFTVKLPLMPIQTAPEPNDGSAAAGDLSGIRILVVDDEPDSREFIAFVLEQAGAQVTTAATASEALSRLAEMQFDVLLSDIGMPEMDGYMLIQQVRALAAQTSQIPAIALTAYAGDFNQRQALAVGFQQHLAKPIEPSTLVATVAALLTKTDVL